MRLHEDPVAFRDAVSIAANQLMLSEIYVEKDYWVTLALHQIFTSPASEFAVFKGGTALAKCFHIINRFSEDIDIVVLRDQSLSANQLKQRLKSISNLVAGVLPEIQLAGITNKKGMIRKTAHSYTRQFEGDFGQVRDMVIVESSWLGSAEPVMWGTVSSFIYEMMEAGAQSALAAKYGLLPFEVRVLASTRTFCEKVMSLVRFSHTENSVENLKNKIRHIYDLHQLLTQGEIADFFKTDQFDEMLHKVARDDEVSFKNNKAWLYLHPGDASIFADRERIWREIKPTYMGTFKRMVYGEAPSEGQVFNSLCQIAERLSGVTWSM